jgi:hypothetical protein
VLMGIVAPIIFGTLGALVLWAAIAVRTDPDNIFVLLLIAGFFGFFFILVLLRIPKLLSNKPQIIIDEVGITNNQRWKALKIPWNDIRELSFPCRYVSRYARQHVLSIKFKNPRLYDSQVPFLHKVNMMFTSDSGDYEISFEQLDDEALSVYRYLKGLQRINKVSFSFGEGTMIAVNAPDKRSEP